MKTSFIPKVQAKALLMAITILFVAISFVGLSAPAAAAATTVTTAEELQAALNNGGEIVLGADIGVNDTLTVKANTTLDLNGYKLTVIKSNSFKNGIVIDLGKTLTVTDSKYSSATNPGSGKLYAKGFTGIQTTGATLIIEKGVVEAVGASAAGIGGGTYGDDGGTVIINGGTVTATGGIAGTYGGAGIGGVGGGSGASYNGNGGTITINGGTVTATGGYGAGIGSGGNASYNGQGGTITINGGVVTAAGGSNGGAGIGGGGIAGVVTINGGTVTATGGGNSSAGIGGSNKNSGGVVTINGGVVTATGVSASSASYGGAGIGGGNSGDGSTVKITAGTVKATGGGNAYDIGSGANSSNGGSLEITGGTLELVKNGTNVVNPSFKSCTVTGDGAGTYKGTYDTNGNLITPKTATPTSSTVLVNGKSVSFDAYTIDGNNYFKLRDLAYILSGTAKQFEVEWDGGNNAIRLTSGKSYTSVGGEMDSKGTGSKTATPTTSTVHIDGVKVNLTAYTIDGNNYFKLRDIGQAFNFGVDWDGAKNTILIDTSKGYTAD